MRYAVFNCAVSKLTRGADVVWQSSISSAASVLGQGGSDFVAEFSDRPQVVDRCKQPIQRLAGESEHVIEQLGFGVDVRGERGSREVHTCDAAVVPGHRPT